MIVKQILILLIHSTINLHILKDYVIIIEKCHQNIYTILIQNNDENTKILNVI